MMLDAFGVKLDDKNIEKLIPRILGPQNIEHPEPDKHILDMPLPVRNVLVKRAADRGLWALRSNHGPSGHCIMLAWSSFI